MTHDLIKQLVIVTGGAQNIGRSITQAFIDCGATVVVADLNSPEITHKRLHYIQTNVANEDSVTQLMNQVEQQFEQLNTLVNNAGICIEEPLYTMSVEDFDKTMAVNVRSVFLTCKHGLKLLKKSRHASIVNISSIEALGANPLHAAYAASKGAVASITNNIALEYGPFGVRCNAIAPGWINTPFNENLLKQYPNRAKVDQEITALHPVGRLGLPEDVANTAVWLASDKAAFITGQEVIVDGGRLAKLPTPNL